LLGPFKRDYVNGVELRDAETVLAQRGRWIDDDNTLVILARAWAGPAT